MFCSGPMFSQRADKLWEFPATVVSCFLVRVQRGALPYDVFKEEEKAGIGVIIRNCHGMVMASLSQKISLPQTVVEMETLAATRALEFSLELGFSKAILEGDSETVIKALQDGSPSLAPFGLLLIRDAQEAANFFTCISYVHVRRNGNYVAHNLARYARHITGFSVWMEDVPFQTLAAYQADLLIS
ncbi:hypothetical protein SO802_008664 [Lithocarpus litseifolius]|uniref:RNase H type-1 domain-containing protein n=1 Tax=Lithocarpus litseifolius TaxID=425828 RepID=A0AAW2D9A2_9ROSI